VPVAPAAQAELRVVQVDRPHAREADPALQLVERLLVPCGCRHVVARRVEVARVEADPHALGTANGSQDLLDVLEAVAEVRALAGGHLEERHHVEAGRALEDVVEAAGDGGEPRLLPRPHVGAGMEDEVADAEGVAARHVGEEGGAAPPQRGGEGAAEVDEIGAVGEHDADAARREGGPEGRGLALAHGPGLPLELAAREDLDRLRGDGLSVLRRPEEPAGDGDVRAQHLRSGWP
jgi:hypothetical protein